MFFFSAVNPASDDRRTDTSIKHSRYYSGTGTVIVLVLFVAEISIAVLAMLFTSPSTNEKFIRLHFRAFSAVNEVLNSFYRVLLMITSSVLYESRQEAADLI